MRARIFLFILILYNACKTYGQHYTIITVAAPAFMGIKPSSTKTLGSLCMTLFAPVYHKARILHKKDITYFQTSKGG